MDEWGDDIDWYVARYERWFWEARRQKDYADFLADPPVIMVERGEP